MYINIYKPFGILGKYCNYYIDNIWEKTLYITAVFRIFMGLEIIVHEQILNDPKNLGYFLRFPEEERETEAIRLAQEFYDMGYIPKRRKKVNGTNIWYKEGATVQFGGHQKDVTNVLEILMYQKRHPEGTPTMNFKELRTIEKAADESKKNAKSARYFRSQAEAIERKKKRKSARIRKEKDNGRYKPSVHLKDEIVRYVYLKTGKSVDLPMGDFRRIASTYLGKREEFADYVKQKLIDKVTKS